MKILYVLRILKIIIYCDNYSIRPLSGSYGTSERVSRKRVPRMGRTELWFYVSRSLVRGTTSRGQDGISSDEERELPRTRNDGSVLRVLIPRFTEYATYGQSSGYFICSSNPESRTRSVRQFSEIVRTVCCVNPSGVSASTSSETRTLALSTEIRC